MFSITQTLFMSRWLAVLAASLLSLAILAPQIAEAKKLCTIRVIEGESKGHLAKSVARARAWVNWQGKMRNAYGRRFSVVQAEVVKLNMSKHRRRWTAVVRARGCYRKPVSCVTGTGITPACECQTNITKAAQQGCSVYAAR